MVMETNFVGPVNFLSEIANRYEKNKSGTIVGVSSVAGERGRSINYFYGASKSGMTTFLSGLRNRLAKKNVHVLTVLPGTVYTKFIHISYLILTRFIHLPYQAHCQSTTRNTLKTNPKIHQKYLPNPPKMGPESLPGTLLGASGEKVTFI